MKTKTILIEYSRAREPVRAQVPENATVTFGGLIPGAKIDGGQNRTALRVYVGKRQIAVFTGVSDFRFIDEVPVLEKRVQEAVKNIIVEEDGVQRQKSVTVRTEDWVNPDAAKPTSSAPEVFNQLQIEAR